MLRSLQRLIIHHQLFLLSKENLFQNQTKTLFFLNFSLINRDYQSTNIGTGQTIMLRNSPNSIVLTRQQQQQQAQPVCRNLIKQEPMIYTTTTGRNDLCYEPNIKQTRLWQ